MIQLLLGRRNLSTITEEAMALIVLHNNTNPTECYDWAKYFSDQTDLALKDNKRNEFEYYSLFMHLMVSRASISIKRDLVYPEDSTNLYVQESFTLLHSDENKRSYSACAEVLFLPIHKICFDGF